MVSPSEYPVDFSQGAIRIELSAANCARSVVRILFEEDIFLSFVLKEKRIGIIVTCRWRYDSDTIQLCLRKIGLRPSFAICENPLLSKTEPREQTPQHAHKPGQDETWHRLAE